MSIDTDNSRVEKFERIRENDHVILSAIDQGHDNVRSLNAQLHLTRRQIHYSLKEKLAPLGLIELSQPDGFVEETIDGQHRRYRAPKEARLTDLGKRYLEETDCDTNLDPYRAMTRDEMAQALNDLDRRIERLEDGFEQFRRQVLAKLEQNDRG